VPSSSVRPWSGSQNETVASDRRHLFKSTQSRG
jgi:hypothetical protein